MLSRALETHSIAEKPKNREWIHILLAFFKTYAESAGAELVMSEESKVAYMTQLMDALKNAVSSLDAGMWYFIL